MQMEKLYPAPGHQPRERFERDNHYPAVRALRELPDELQNDVLHTYEQRRKKLLWAYILWVIVPGFHSFYLGRIRRGILFIASVILVPIWFGWWALDAIKMQDLISEANSGLTSRLLRAAEAQAVQS